MDRAAKQSARGIGFSTQRMRGLTGYGRRAAVGWLLGSLLFASARDAFAETRRFDIAPGSLSDALIAFALQSDRQLLYAPDTVAGIESRALRGQFDVQHALAKLLDGTGIAVRQVNERTVYLERATGADASAQRELSRRTQQEPVRFAVVGDMVVTGSRLRGVEPAGAMVLRLDDDTLSNASRPNVADVLRALPQVLNFGGDEALVGGASVQNSTLNTSYARSINLRGLGTSSTLVLVNERRIAPSGSGAQLTDVSAIPLAAIAHIEIQTDGTSAIYGSDAVGGVVNLILKRRSGEIVSSGRYEYGDDIDGYELSQLVGHDWESGAFTFTYSHSARSRLLAADRPHLYNDDFTRYGGTDNRSLHSSPPNIVFDAASVPPGAASAYAVPVFTTNVPLTLAQLDEQTLNRQSIWRGRSVLPEQRIHSVVVSAEQRIAGSAQFYFDGFFARRDFEQAMPNVAGTFATVLVPASNPYSPCHPHANPSNAFGIDCAGRPVSVRYSSIADLGISVRSGQYAATHLSAGVQIEAGDWMADLSLTSSKSKTRRASNNFMNNAALAMAVGNSVDSSGAIVPDGTPDAFTRPASVPLLNPFCVGCNSAATAEFLRSGQFLGSDYEQRSLLGSLNGPLGELPGGAVRAAVGFELREDWFTSFNDLNTALVYDTPTNTQLHHTGSSNSRDLASAFMELHVPIVGPANARPGLRGLELALSARREAYDDLGTQSNPRIGLRYSPTPSLSFFATYATSFRAPTLSDSDPRSTAQVGAGPPAGGVYTAEQLQIEQGEPGRQLFVIGRAGGNADLEPETAKSWSGGLTWRPFFAPATRLSLNYYSIEYNHRIDTPGANAGPVTAITHPTGYFDEFITFNPAFFPERAQRNRTVDGLDTTTAAGFEALLRSLYFANEPPFAGTAPDPADVVAVLDGRRSNAARLTTRGVDLSLQTEWPSRFGRFQFDLAANFVFEWKTAPSSSAPLIDSVDRIFNPVSKQATARLTWQRAPWSATLTSRYTGSYVNDTLSQPLRNMRVDDYLVHDAVVAYSFDDAWSSGLNDVRVTLGVQNLLDEAPPLALNTNIVFDPQYASALGRYWTLSLAKHW
jgi:iron complex outermembrane receptor protein